MFELQTHMNSSCNGHEDEQHVVIKAHKFEILRFFELSYIACLHQGDCILNRFMPSSLPCFSEFLLFFYPYILRFQCSFIACLHHLLQYKGPALQKSTNSHHICHGTYLVGNLACDSFVCVCTNQKIVYQGKSQFRTSLGCFIRLLESCKKAIDWSTAQCKILLLCAFNVQLP